MSTLIVSALLGADAAYIYVQKIVVPRTLEAFAKADRSTQLAVGAAAGTYARGSREALAQFIPISPS